MSRGLLAQTGSPCVTVTAPLASGTLPCRGPWENEGKANGGGVQGLYIRVKPGRLDLEPLFETEVAAYE